MSKHNSWGNQFTDNSDRHCEDQLLRQHGYSIWSRPKRGEPVWRAPNGDEVLESAALASLKKAEA